MAQNKNARHIMAGKGKLSMLIRDVAAADALQISAFLKELTAIGKRIRPDDEIFVLKNYISDPEKICCFVAEEDGIILGFQSLKKAVLGNQWDVEPGWGIIGTHINPVAARRGVGRALFGVTVREARKSGLLYIDASIGTSNSEALAYYGAMGFQTYRTTQGRICKRFDLGDAVSNPA